MNKIIVLIALILSLNSCSDEGNVSPDPPKNEVESMYSWLNIDAQRIWQYSKQTKFRHNPWVDEEPEYAKYNIISDTSSFYTMYKVSDNESNLTMDLSYDSTSLYMNSFSVGDNFVDPVLKKLDFKRVKIADLNETEWDVDTLFYEDIAVDEKNTFYGYIAFKAKRVSDSTVVFNDKEEITKRFELEIRIIANQEEEGYFFTVYPGYYISLIDNVGFFRILLRNHTNTAIKVEEFDYILKDIE